MNIFPNTIMLLKVDHFEGFSNSSNVDEMVTNIVRVDVTVTITNLIITLISMKTMFSYSENFLI